MHLRRQQLLGTDLIADDFIIIIIINLCIGMLDPGSGHVEFLAIVASLVIVLRVRHHLSESLDEGNVGDALNWSLHSFIIFLQNWYGRAFLMIFALLIHQNFILRILPLLGSLGKSFTHDVHRIHFPLISYRIHQSRRLSIFVCIHLIPKVLI